MEYIGFGLLRITILALLGCWGWKIMDKKGRNTTVGAILGVLLGFIGIIICYCHSDKNKIK